MSAVEIVEAVLAAGGTLVLSGERIRYQIPEQGSPLIEELRRHKTDVVSLLRQRERLKDFSRLLPFLGKRVWSPVGPGQLLVVEDYITVRMEDGTKRRWYDPAPVIPYA